MMFIPAALRASTRRRATLRLASLRGATQRFFLVGAIMVVSGAVSAAEMNACHAYANRTSALALRALLNVPSVDASVGVFIYRKAYSYCLNADEVPQLVFTPEEAPIVAGVIPPGTLPATGLEESRGRLPLTRSVSPTSPTASPKVVSADTDQPLCIKHNMKTVYRGKSWRCRK